MATISLLRKLFDIFKELISSCNRLAKKARIRLLQKLAYLWTLARAYCSKAKTTRTTDPKRDPPPPPALVNSPKYNDCKEGSTTETNPATISHTHDDVIPLDSSISCSLHPDPDMVRGNASRTSFQHGLNLAQPAHASQNAPRSTLNLPPSPSDTHSDQEGYTFIVKSPKLGSGQEGEGEGTNSSSPAESVLALPASVASIHAENLDHDLDLAQTRIFPIMPEFFQRYDRQAFLKEEETKMIIDPFTLDFQLHPDPPGWKPIANPEGILCFYNEEKKAVTEANLYEDVYYQKITSDIATLEDFIRAKKFKMPENYTLAMDLNMQPNGTIDTDYYYVDHCRRIVFFLEEIEAQTNIPVWSQLKGVTSVAHLKHEIEAQYWYHGKLYPSTIELKAKHVVELGDVILHYLGDLTITSYSLSIFSADELNAMLSQVNTLRENVEHSLPGAASFLSQMMHIFARQRFHNWHSTPQARIYYDQSVHGKCYRKTLLIKILSPLLFSAPDIHLASLRNLWVDQLMLSRVWKEAIETLSQEWREFTLCATVLLNANVAYLAIQSIDNNPPGYRSPAQISCYLSIVASLGSIIIGLLLMRQNTARNHGLDKVNTFLQVRSSPGLGLETLAILYSLPYALLLWA
ncbi:hypothetical protein EST38_g10653 [Candolleomyces aberdarensis]|uniref:WW domain-containing protein n=1 Tax=Candolleomyces aberdarensis TaxID=2316362 RepID=A0A4Q2D6U3_9AGAR|nr:hypothetical protein EST38_g10653 [Candolleomyces aberdarensis]